MAISPVGAASAGLSSGGATFADAAAKAKQATANSAAEQQQIEQAFIDMIGQSLVSSLQTDPFLQLMREEMTEE